VEPVGTDVTLQLSWVREGDSPVGGEVFSSSRARAPFCENAADDELDEDDDCGEDGGRLWDEEDEEDNSNSAA